MGTGFTRGGHIQENFTQHNAIDPGLLKPQLQIDTGESQRFVTDWKNSALKNIAIHSPLLSKF